MGRLVPDTTWTRRLFLLRARSPDRFARPRDLDPLHRFADTTAHGGRRHGTLEEIEMFGFGAAQLMMFALVALLLFGNRLPNTMRSLGESLREFKRGLNSADENQNEIAR